MQYVQLSAIVSELSALSSEMSGGGNATTITGNDPDSVAIDGDIQVMAMLSSNVSCKTYIDQNNNHIMELGVFYV